MDFSQLTKADLIHETTFLAPYLFSPSNQISESEVLVICLNRLVNPPDLNTNPCWKSKLGGIFLTDQEKVVGQFVRKFLDKNFPRWKMRKHWDKDTKKIINLQADLLGQTWKLIKLLPSDQCPKPYTLYVIALERKIFLFNYNVSEPTATKNIKKNQSINRTLQSLSNPFCKEDAYFTWEFIDRCHKFASRSNDFRVDYLKLVSLRMSLVQKLKASGVRVMDQDGNIKEKRGRKSIPPSRNRSG